MSRNKIVEYTNLDKIWFPKSDIRKGDIIDYYQAIAPWMIPLSKDHPLSMQRFPNGIAQESFYHKDAPDYFPSWIVRTNVASSTGKIVHYVVLQDAQTLLYIVNQGCLTPHIWLSRLPVLDKPDRLIFDLDPSTKNFDQVRQVALLLKNVLESLSLSPFIMTTGSRGLHVVVPLKRKDSFDEVRDCAMRIAQLIEYYNPKVVTTQLRKDKRGTKIFLDYLRNSQTATAVAPYAVRAREGAPVATPLFWPEVENARLRSDFYTIATVHKKIKRDGNPWEQFYRCATTLTKAKKLLWQTEQSL